MADNIVELLDPARLTVIGLLTFLLMAFIRGWIVPGWAYRDRDIEADKIRAQRDELIDAFRRDVIPALVNSTHALERSNKVLEKRLEN